MLALSAVQLAALLPRAGPQPAEVAPGLYVLLRPY
jgi:hypothetical protein